MKTSPSIPTKKRKRSSATDYIPSASSSRSSGSSDSDADSDSTSSSDAEEFPTTKNAPPPVDEDDAPALSHAQKRKEKKRSTKQAEKAGPPNKKRKVESSSSGPALPARQNSIWVGNMSFKTTQDNLRDFFKQRGVDAEITRVNMPMKSGRSNGPSENRGFAYVDFSSVEAQKAAIALSEEPLLGRKLLIKDGSDFKGRPQASATSTDNPSSTSDPKTHTKSAQKILRDQKQPPAPTLFLGNLGFETTVEGIQGMFEGHRRGAKKEAGKEEEDEPDFIRKVRMGTFEDSGNCKGFAFVDFPSIDAATDALTNSRNHKLDGRDLVVEYASADAVKRGASKSLLPKKGGVGGLVKKRQSPRRERQLKREMKLKLQAAAGEGNAKGEEAPSHGKKGSKEKKEASSPSRPGGRNDKEVKKGWRPKPGAALALAKRESAAIVQSQGKKVTF